MKHCLRWAAAVPVSMALLSLSCSSASPAKEGPEGGEEEAGPKADAGTTFTEVYTTIIAPTCTGSACHNSSDTGGSDAGDGSALDMSSQSIAYKQLVNVSAAGFSCAGMGIRVVPGNANSSLLYEKVSEVNPPCGNQMPFHLLGHPPATPLTSAQQALIENWINDGAMND